MEIIANCQYGEERAKQFFRFHMLVKSPSKYIYWGLSLISLAFGVYLIANNEGYFGIFCLFLAIIFIVVWLSSAHMTINKVMKDIRFPILKYQLKMSDTHLTLLEGDNKKAFLWSDMHMVCETRTNIYFYVNRQKALILGKYILSDQEREDLNALLIKNKVLKRFYRFQ